MVYLCPQYAEDQAAFFADYCVSHAKLSELGAEWEVCSHHQQLAFFVCQTVFVSLGEVQTEHVGGLSCGCVCV